MKITHQSLLYSVLTALLDIYPGVTLLHHSMDWGCWQ